MTPQPEISLESEKKRLDPHVCDPEFVACEVEVETTPSFWRPQSGPLEYFESPKTFTEPVKKPARQRYYIPKRSDLWKIQGFLDALDSSDLSDDSSDDTDPAHNDSDNVMSPKKRILQDDGSSDRNASESSQEREPVQLTPPVSDVNKPVQRDQRESRTIIDVSSDEEPLQKKSRSADKPKEDVMVEKMEPSTRSCSSSVKKPSEPESGNSSGQQKANEESKNVEDSSNKNNDKSEKPSRSDRSKLQNKVTPSEAPPKTVIESSVEPQSDDSSDASDQLATMPRENPETEVIETVVIPQAPCKLPPPQHENVQKETTGIVAIPQEKTSPSEPQHEKPQEVIIDMAVIPHGQLQPPPQYQLDSILEQDLPAFGSLLDSLDRFFESERAQTTSVDKIYENIIQQNNNLAISEVEREMLGPYQMHRAHLENPNDEQKEAIGSFRSKLAEITRHYMTTRRWEEHNPLMVAFKENKAALQALLANPAQLAIGDKSTSLGEAPPLMSLCRPAEDPERRQEEQKLLAELRCKAETEFHMKIVEEFEVVMAPNSQQSDRASAYAFLGPSLLSALYGPNPTQSTSGFGTSHFPPSSSYPGPSTSYGQWHGY